jgi:hypothetical protein
MTGRGQVKVECFRRRHLGETGEKEGRFLQCANFSETGTLDIQR